MALTVSRFGPLTGGVVDGANATADLSRHMRYARQAIYDGIGRLKVRRGGQVALTLMDDQGTPAPITSICQIAPFSDSALIVGHSTVTQKAYLYRPTADVTGWYNAAGALQTTATPAPVGVLWSSMATAPVVTIAEGLGKAYLAAWSAADTASLNWGTKVYTQPGTLAALTSDLDDDGTAEPLYFSVVISFQQSLWGFGFGEGVTAATGYNPSLARFSKIDFDASPEPNTGDLFAPGDSFTLGDRVASERERIVGAAVAGDALFVGSSAIVTRFTGYGRDSWQKMVLDRSYGFAGPRAAVTAGTTLYYWSTRGPMRIAPNTAPEPLWDAIPETVSSVMAGGDPAGMIGAFDPDTDQVRWYYQSAASEGRLRYVAWDVRRDVYLGPDSSAGVAVGAAAFVTPAVTVASAPAGPLGAPTAITLSGLGATQVTLTLTLADPTADTFVYYKRSSDTDWTETALAPGVATITLTGLDESTAYNTEASAFKNGRESALFTGPSFTTLAPTCMAPTGIAVSATRRKAPQPAAIVTWTNTESGATTEVWAAPPGASGYSPIYTAPVGVGSYSVPPLTDPSQEGTYGFEVRHTKAAFTPSAYDGPVTASLLYFP